MRALVTGCAGFIGSHLSEALLGDGHAARDRLLHGRLRRSVSSANLEARPGNGTDCELAPLNLASTPLEGLVADCDTIFHLAAEPGVHCSWEQRFKLLPCSATCSPPRRRAIGSGTTTARGAAGRTRLFDTWSSCTPIHRSPGWRILSARRRPCGCPFITRASSAATPRGGRGHGGAASASSSLRRAADASALRSWRRRWMPTSSSRTGATDAADRRAPCSPGRPGRSLAARARRLERLRAGPLGPGARPRAADRRRVGVASAATTPRSSC